MLPSFIDTLRNAKTETALENAFERLVDRADDEFMRGDYRQDQYDVWYDAAVALFDLRMWEIHRDKVLASLED